MVRQYHSRTKTALTKELLDRIAPQRGIVRIDEETRGMGDLVKATGKARQRFIASHGEFDFDCAEGSSGRSVSADKHIESYAVTG